jgi:DNA-directed RNA polymerase II subunit RPB7
MFFIRKQLKRGILLEPHTLGAKLEEQVRMQLIEEVEGKCLGKFGYVIRLLGTDNIVPGFIENDSGSVNVEVTYSCFMLRPFKNEVLDTIVFSAANEMGFWARMGPLEIFVHKNAMPEDMKFDYAAGDAWVSDDGTIEIKDGSIVRLRIIGVSVDAGQMNAVGSIDDPYLGQLE